MAAKLPAVDSNAGSSSKPAAAKEPTSGSSISNGNGSDAEQSAHPKQKARPPEHVCRHDPTLPRRLNVAAAADRSGWNASYVDIICYRQSSPSMELVVMPTGAGPTSARALSLAIFCATTHMLHNLLTLEVLTYISLSCWMLRAGGGVHTPAKAKVGQSRSSSRRLC